MNIENIFESELTQILSHASIGLTINSSVFPSVPIHKDIPGYVHTVPPFIYHQMNMCLISLFR